MKQRRCTILVSLMAAALPAVCFSASECPAPQLALGRPHIDFVQWQAMSSRVLGPTNSLPGVKATALSYDAKGTRAVTVIFEFPAGWSMDKPHYLNSDQEFLVLSGQLEIDGEVYSEGDYAYFPAGLQHQLLRSTGGATLVNFYEGEHLAFYAPTPKGMYQRARLIRHIASTKLRWKTARDGSRYKLLRRDGKSGEQTWLVQVPATDAKLIGTPGKIETRDAVEEFLLLDGELTTPRGVMHSGAYAWRAPRTPVGPAASSKGYTALLRSKGGAPGGSASGDMLPIALDAPFQPCIPDNVRATLEAGKAPAK